MQINRKMSICPISQLWKIANPVHAHFLLKICHECCTNHSVHWLKVVAKARLTQYRVWKKNLFLRIYRVRLKKCPRRKLQFLQNYSIFQYEIFYSCLWRLAALRLILSWNFINLHRNGNTWDTKLDFCKSPANINS